MFLLDQSSSHSARVCPLGKFILVQGVAHLQKYGSIRTFHQFFPIIRFLGVQALELHANVPCSQKLLQNSNSCCAPFLAIADICASLHHMQKCVPPSFRFLPADRLFH